MKSLLGGVAGLLFVLAVPLLIFGTSALAIVLDPDYYGRGQVEHQVESVYGLPQRVLMPVNRAVVGYLAGDTETLAQSLSAHGADPAFFDERETVHMADVRALVRLVALVQRASLVYGTILIVASLLLLGTRAIGRIGSYLVAGGVLAVAVVAFLGALTVMDFGGLFLRFHLLSFSNDFWVLDPRTEHLIQMFPFGFFRDAVLSGVVRSLLTTAVVTVVGGFLVWLGRRLL